MRNDPSENRKLSHYLPTTTYYLLMDGEGKAGGRACTRILVMGSREVSWYGTVRSSQVRSGTNIHYLVADLDTMDD